MKKILLTGATGFIGNNLLEFLSKENYKIYALVREPSKLGSFGENVEVIKGDLRDEKLVLPEVDFVYHIGGLTKAKNYKEFYHVNYGGTLNLVNSIKKQKSPLKRFIFLSTLAINCDKDEKIINNNSKNSPKTHYAKSKLLAEEYLLKHKDDFKLIIVRPTAVYGPKEKELLHYFKILKKGYAPVLNKSGLFSFIFVYDLVNILILLLNYDIKSGTILLSSDGNKYLWNDVIKLAAQKMNVNPKIIDVPKFVMLIAATFSTFFNKFKRTPSILTLDKLQEIYKSSWVCDISLIKELLNYTIEYDLDRGLDATIKWYKINRWL